MSYSLCTQHRTLYMADAQKYCFSHFLKWYGSCSQSDPTASKSREGRQEVMDLSYLFHSQHVNDLVK